MDIHLKAKIRKRLEENVVLTVLDVFREFGTFEGRHYFSELRKEINLKDVWDYNPDTKKRFKRYYLVNNAA